MRYVVDTNFFITAHRQHYPFDVVKSFWEKVGYLASEDLILSIDKVKSEIFKNNDYLRAWCDDYLPSGFFCDSSVCYDQYVNMMSWASSKSNHYNTNAIAEFADSANADPFLISYTLSDKSNLKLVTYEVKDGSKKKIKIPDPCDDHGVEYLTPIQMFRELGISF